MGLAGAFDAFQEYGSGSDLGREYENHIEHRGRAAGDIWLHMVPAGNQRVARQLYERANSMGGLRRSCGGRGYRCVAVD